MRVLPGVRSIGGVKHTPRHLRAFDTRGLAQVFADVVVVGSGIAGNAAALAAAEAGARVSLLTKDGRLESNTLYAQAGLAAAVGADDSMEMHVADTLAAGDGLCHAGVVRAVVADGPSAIRKLEGWGVSFDRAGPGGGTLLLGREGGHQVRRVAHSKGDATGRQIQEAMTREVGRHSAITVADSNFAVDLLSDGPRCVGVLTDVRGELRVVWGASVVIATGGAARLFRESTNPSVTTGDGIAMAYRAGASLRDMEFMQFHPTVLYVPGAPRKLVSEAARGEGALIVDPRGERFLPGFDPRGELAPRDVVSRAIVAHMLAHGFTHVYLDLRQIDPARLAERLPGVVETGRAVGIDVTRDMLPIRPAAHYTVGGIVTDADGTTDVPGLFAAGEASSSGLHGANRLASNSLLEGVVMGGRAGAAAADEAAKAGRPSACDQSSAGPGPAAGEVDVGDLMRSVESLVWRKAGVQRNERDLADALTELRRWNRLELTRTMPDLRGVEAQNLCILAELLVEAALLRRETRGVHGRTDFPGRDDARFRGHIVQRRGETATVVPLAAGSQAGT
jgi:L-aspartate oxidase